MIRSFTLVALATSCLAMPATAQTGDGIAIVHHADLDLSRMRDIKRLDRRISRAAAAACGPVSTIDPVGTNLHVLCTRETIAAARKQRDAAVRRRSGVQQASAR
uniref:UrcA family protein n=1 Tax=uncultured Sphingomonas sp. TaxID=158754 RepID=UPI0035CB1047